MRFLTSVDLAKPLPVSIGLGGASGSGKTYSALRLGRGMATELAGTGAPFAYVDTENRRALHYRTNFPEMLEHYLDFGPEDENGALVGYPPERWMAALDFVEASKAAALVIDSFSHAWEGVNGVLDLQAEALARLGGGEKNSLRAWAQIKPRYRKLINRLIQSRIPLVICSRAKPAIPDPKNPGRNLMPTKLRRDDVPFDISGDRDLIFEMTVMAILDPQHPGCPVHQIKVPDAFKATLPPDRPITEETGRELARWSLDQKSATETKTLMDAARDKAREGSAAIEAWWKARSRDEQALLLAIRSELKEAAQRADSAPEETQDSLFGETAVDTADDEMAASEPEDSALAQMSEEFR